MAKPPSKRIPHKFQPWIRVRKQYRLSHAHVQMARELGLEPRRFGSYADTKDQPWKSPLPQFIESLYLKRFGIERPENVRSIEEIASDHIAKRLARKKSRAAMRMRENTGEGEAQGDTSTPHPADADSAAPPPDSSSTEPNSTEPNTGMEPVSPNEANLTPWQRATRSR